MRKLEGSIITTGIECQYTGEKSSFIETCLVTTYGYWPNKNQTRAFKMTRFRYTKTATIQKRLKMLQKLQREHIMICKHKLRYPNHILICLTY